MPKLNSHRVYLLICSVAMFLFVLNSVIYNTDLWFLLSNGDYIRQNWLPTYDWQSVYGYPIVIYQAGTDIVFSWLNEWFDIGSLDVLCAFVWAGIMLVICSFTKKQHFLSYTTAVLATAIALSLNTVLRPQMFSLLFTLVLIRILYDNSERTKMIACATILPLQLFFHATFWILLVTICVWYCICYKPTKEVVCGIVVGILFSLLYTYCATPYGLKLLLHPFYCLGMSAYGQIDELQSMAILWSVCAFILFAVSLLILYKTQIHTVKNIKRQDLFIPVMTLVATIGTTIAARLTLFAYCLIGILLILSYRNLKFTVKLFNKCFGAIIMCGLLLTFNVNVDVQKLKYNNLYEREDAVGKFLVQVNATSALTNLDMTAPYLYNKYGIQSYFDTRLETYIPSFNETEDVFTPYIDWMKGDDTFVREKSPEWLLIFSEREDTPVPENYHLREVIVQDNEGISQRYRDYVQNQYDEDLAETSTVKIYQRDLVDTTVF